MSDITLLILTLIVLATLLRLDFIFYIVYVVAAIYAWSRWYPSRAFRKLNFERQFTDHAFLGERIQVTLTFRNEGWLPIPWLQVAESVPPELSRLDTTSHALSLGRGEEVTFTYDIQPTRRGYYRLGPLHLRTGDLFGWSEQTGQSQPSYLTVYPRITPLTQLGFPSRLPFGTIASRQRLFEDPARPVGVREYRSGDSQRQINWKVSAHSNNLVVKTLQPAISLDTSIMLNLNMADYDRKSRYTATEWAIEVAASLAAHLVERQQAVGLTVNGIDPLLQMQSEAASENSSFSEVSGRLQVRGEEGTEEQAAIPGPIAPRGGRAHLMKLLELLARVEPGSALSIEQWIPRASLNLSWGITVPLVTPRGDEKTCQVLHRLVRAGLNPVLIVIAPTAHFAQTRERARSLGFRAYYIPYKEDLNIWRRPVFRTSV
jgi:uncharacterized protein (DUF58 family)